MACAAKKQDTFSTETSDSSESGADQYHVYVHYDYKDNVYRPGWEKKKTTRSKMNALRAAQALRRRERYTRIEVKKTAFDSYAWRYTDTKFKTYRKSLGVIDWFRKISREATIVALGTFFALGVLGLKVAGLL